MREMPQNAASAFSSARSRPRRARELCPLIVGGGYKRVVLAPLLIVAGDHANNDMAGPGEDSWKSVFEAGGLKVDCVIRGLGENADIRRVFVRHASEAVSG